MKVKNRVKRTSLGGHGTKEKVSKIRTTFSSSLQTADYSLSSCVREQFVALSFAQFIRSIYSFRGVKTAAEEVVGTSPERRFVSGFASSIAV